MGKSPFKSKWIVVIGCLALATILFVGMVMLLFFVAIFSPLAKGSTPMGDKKCVDIGGGKKATAQQFDQHLEGLLKGKGSIFMSKGQVHGVDPTLLTAISMHETGNGTSNVLRKYHNPGGLMKASGPMRFATLEEGIDRMASNLGRNYIQQGLTTPEKIRNKYAPVRASNDPGNLNRHWIDGIKTYIQKLGGPSLQCEEEKIMATGDVKKMIDEAKTLIGRTQYVLGGNSFPSTLDCSSFVLNLYKRHFKLPLPRTAAEQVKKGRPVNKNELVPGDLVFFAGTYKAGVSHVGISMGGNTFIHAANSKDDVRISSLNEPYYKSHWHSARRIIQQK